ncbi:MAG: hypothetical protein VYE73_09865 [Acidobacteriota bacterium]|nr:hypothetical protein [Acidobacteriota bacterium]
MSTLVVFDLDATLIRSVRLDAECFKAAFREGFGLEVVGDDWQRFEHVTDQGICRHAASCALRVEAGRGAGYRELVC